MESDSKKDPKAAFQRQPYYECIFCKRGLSTAQALGGHMNVHRKDRAKFQQPPVMAAAAAAMPLPNKKPEADGLELHGPLFSHVLSEPSSCTTYLSLHESWVGLGDMMKAALSQEDQISCSGRSQEVKLPGEDLELSLTLHISDSDFKEQELEGEVLDLELRLGH